MICCNKEMKKINSGWAKNGEAAGTAGYSYRLEAIDIKLVPKGANPPGSTAGTYIMR